MRPKEQLREERKSVYGKTSKIWLKSKRDIALALGFDPDNINRSDMQKVESKFNSAQGIGARWMTGKRS